MKQRGLARLGMQFYFSEKCFNVSLDFFFLFKLKVIKLVRTIFGKIKGYVSENLLWVIPVTWVGRGANWMSGPSRYQALVVHVIS